MRHITYEEHWSRPRLIDFAFRRLRTIGQAARDINLRTGVPMRTVPDIGCVDLPLGVRFTGPHFAHNYHDVRLTSPEIASARLCSSSHTTFHLFDGPTLSFSAREVNLAVPSNVVEHVEYPRVLPREARRAGHHMLVEFCCAHTGRLARDYVRDSAAPNGLYTPKTITRLVPNFDMTFDCRVTSGCSLPVRTLRQMWLGLMHFVVRMTVIKLVYAVAPRLFVYHTAPLCR